jgi:hypothetical protein
MPGPPSGRKSNGPLIAIVIVLVVAAVGAGAFFLLSGDDKGSGPEDVARSYYDAVTDRDCDAMVDLVDLGGESRDTLLSECRQLVESDALSDEIAEEMAATMPVELVSIDTVSETETDATLTVEYRTQGGSTETTEVVLVNDGSGWLISAENSFGSGTSAPEGELTPPEGDIDPPDDFDDPGSDDPGSDGSDAGSDDPALGALSDSCGAGDMAACDDLWLDSDVGSDLEAFAETCGGLDPAGGHFGDCEVTFG